MVSGLPDVCYIYATKSLWLVGNSKFCQHSLKTTYTAVVAGERDSNPVHPSPNPTGLQVTTSGQPYTEPCVASVNTSGAA